jgi:Early transcription elongation factor of RNA pol II, NGN section
MRLVAQIYNRCISALHPYRLDVTSVLARDGIPGYIFVEGSFHAVEAALDGLVAVRNLTPRLVPSDQRIALLASRNQCSRRIEEGQWVRCLHGLYRDDIGFVCGWDSSSDKETIVAFVPRIPHMSDRPIGSSTGKRKRARRPLPLSWSSAEATLVWGAERVQSVSPDKFIFRRETYESRLIMKHLPPNNLVVVDSPPNNFKLFFAASCIREMPSFTPWIHHFVQDSLQPQQRIKVESGEQAGLVGQISEIIDSVAAIVPVPPLDDLPMPHIPLRHLAPHYLPGDHVKVRWSDSCGIVMSVDGGCKTLVYVEKDSVMEVRYITFT